MPIASRRRFLGASCAAVALPAFSRVAWAQSYPARALRVMAGVAPGGAADVAARMVSELLAQRLGKPVALGTHPARLASEFVAKTAPDGYSLLLANGVDAINATLYHASNADFVREIAAVAGLMRLPLVMVVNPGFATPTLANFVTYARRSPGRISMGSTGEGTVPHVAGELFGLMARSKIENVSFRSNADALAGLMAGRTHLMFAPIEAAIGHVRAGRLRALAVTSATRSAALPDTPAVAESVTGYDASEWYVFGAPQRTPEAVVARLNGDVNAVLADAKVRARLGELHALPLVMSPAELRKHVSDEAEKWAKAAKFASTGLPEAGSSGYPAGSPGGYSTGR